MENKYDNERLGRVEEKVDGITDDIKDIKDAIKELDGKFAAKWVQTIVGGLVAVILLAFVGVLVAFFIRDPSANSPTTTSTTTINTPNGSTSTTKTVPSSSSATATAQATPDNPSANQTSTGGVQVTLPKANQ